MYLEKFKRVSGLAALAAFVVSISACAPVVYVDPTVSLDIQLQAEQLNPLSDEASYLVDDAALSSFDSNEGEGLPLVQSVGMTPEDYCLVLSVTGSGLPRAFHDSQGQCSEAFPGLGRLSTPFEWRPGVKPEIEVPLGKRRFDVLAFRKSFFGGQCPAQISATESADQDSFFVNGVKKEFPTGAQAPLLVATLNQQLTVGENKLDVFIRGSGAKVISKPYGCRDFKIFPEPNSEGFVETSMKQPFFDVECPNEAVKVEIKVGKYNPKTTTLSCDRATGRALLQVPSLSGYDSLSLLSNLGLPAITISAIAANGDKVSSKTLKLKFSDDNSFDYVRAADGDILEFETDPNEDIFWIRDVTESSIQIGVGSTQTDQSYEIDVRRETQSTLLKSSRVPLVWAGTDSDESLLGLLSNQSRPDFVNSEVQDLSQWLPGAKFYPEWESPSLVFRELNALKPGSWKGKKTLVLRSQKLAGGSALFIDANGDESRRSVLFRSPNGGQDWYRVFVGQTYGKITDTFPIVTNEKLGQKGVLALEHYQETNDAGALTGKQFLRLLVQKINASGF